MEQAPNELKVKINKMKIQATNKLLFLCPVTISELHIVLADQKSLLHVQGGWIRLQLSFTQKREIPGQLYPISAWAHVVALLGQSTELGPVAPRMHTEAHAGDPDAWQGQQGEKLKSIIKADTLASNK